MVDTFGVGDESNPRWHSMDWFWLFRPGQLNHSHCGGKWLRPLYTLNTVVRVILIQFMESTWCYIQSSLTKRKHQHKARARTRFAVDVRNASRVFIMVFIVSCCNYALLNNKFTGTKVIGVINSHIERMPRFCGNRNPRAFFAVSYGDFGYKCSVSYELDYGWV